MGITNTYNENDLVLLLKSRDSKAFSYLYDNYSASLYGAIAGIIPDSDAAPDILQEVFVKIWRNIKSYDATKGRLYTWMLNITRNHTIDKTRSKDFNYRAKTTELSENVYNNKPGLDVKMDDVGLKKTLGNLPEENRKLLELAYYQGYTQEEISKMLNIPLGTVKTRLRATIIQLRKILSTQ